MHRIGRLRSGDARERGDAVVHGDAEVERQRPPERLRRGTPEGNTAAHRGPPTGAFHRSPSPKRDTRQRGKGSATTAQPTDNTRSGPPTTPGGSRTPGPRPAPCASIGPQTGEPEPHSAERGPHTGRQTTRTANKHERDKTRRPRHEAATRQTTTAGVCRTTGFSCRGDPAGKPGGTRPQPSRGTTSRSPSNRPRVPTPASLSKPPAQTTATVGWKTPKPVPTPASLSKPPAASDCSRRVGAPRQYVLADVAGY